MHAISNLLGTDETRGDRESQEGAVRQIGEILPLVMARYQLGDWEGVYEACEEFSI